MSSESAICTACGAKLAPGSAFCEFCGAPVPAESAVPTPSVAEPVTTQVAIPAPVSAAPAPIAPAPAPIAPPAGACQITPVRLLWDDARAFIAGQSGQFAFRVVADCDVARMGVAATADGEELQPVFFDGLRAGETREGTIPFQPARVGSVAVTIRVKTVLPSQASETFSAGRSPEHVVLPAERLDVRGAGSLVINVQNNTGIVRNDDMKVASALRGARIDRWDEQRQVLGRRGAFSPVGLSSVSVKRETVRLRGAAGDVAIVAGCGTVSFGASSRKASVPLSGLVGATGGNKMRYVSSRHFSVKRDPFTHSVVLRDGAPDTASSSAACGTAPWEPSTNGTCVDGATVSVSGVTLSPGRTYDVSLAPYAVAGGALNISLDATAAPGWLSASVAGQPAAAARPFAVVVWDSVPLSSVLGPEARGLRVSVDDGRLVLFGDGVAPTRLDFLSGRPLPHCPGWSVA